MTELLRTVQRNALKKGREEGREEGRLEEKQAAARRLLALGVDITVIANATGLTVDVIRELVRDDLSQVSGNRS